MSHRRRSRIQTRFSQRSSSISSEGAPLAPIELDDVEIRYATTDPEICAIHQFLLIVAMPAMRCQVDPVGSLNEIIRVAKYEAAMMAILDNKLVGTLGLMKARWWYGRPDDPQSEFMTDRWHFCLPQFYHTAVDAKMMAEAAMISDQAGLEFVDQGKLRERNGKLLMMPRIYVPSKKEVEEA